MAALSRKIAQNTVLQIVGKGIGTLLSLATFAILLSHLDIDRYGALTVALNFAAMFAVIVDFGFTLVAAQMIAEPDADEPSLLGNIFTLRILTSFVLLGGASILVFCFPYAPDVKVAAAVSCLSFFFGSAAWIFVGVFQKRLALGWAVFAEQMNRLVVLGCAIAITAFAPSIIAASAVFVAGSIVQVVVMLFAVGRQLAFTPRVDLEVWKRILSRSWPIGISILFNLVYLRGDILFMSLLGTSDYDIGLYGAAYKVVDVVTTVPVMFMGLVLPMLTFAWAQKDKTAFREHLQRAVDGLSLLAIPFAVGTAAVGGNVLALIDEDLIHAGPVLAILGIATGAVFLNSIFGHTIVALKKQRGMILGYAFTAAAATVGYVVLIPTLGAFGAAWVTLASEVLIGTLTAGVVFAVSRVRLSPLPALRALGASGVMYAVISLVPLPHVLLTVALGILVYIAMLAALGGPHPRAMLGLFLPEKV